MAANPPTIRRAGLGEIETCARLYVAVGRQHFTWLPAEYFRPEAFLRCAEEEDVWVACQRGAIEACLTYYVPEDFLHFLLVDQASRGRGVGSAMLDHIRAQYEARHSLKVNVPNVEARRFYARRGYIETDKGESKGVGWLLMGSP